MTCAQMDCGLACGDAVSTALEGYRTGRITNPTYGHSYRTGALGSNVLSR
jgi:hypothetical protein